MRIDRPGLTRALAVGALLVPLALAVPLVGCGFPSAASSAPERDGTHGDAAADTSADPSAQPADPNAGMVAAVSPTGTVSTRPISVKFRLEARPRVGSPVKIMVALTPAADAQITHLHGSFLPGEGLTMSSERSFDTSELPAGGTLYREVTVVPMQAGVLSLDATILVDTDKRSEANSYLIPLIAVDSTS